MVIYVGVIYMGANHITIIHLARKFFGKRLVIVYERLVIVYAYL